LRGTQQALAAVEVTQDSGGLTIASPDYDIEVVLSCDALMALELIGAVQAELPLTLSLNDIGVFGASRLQAAAVNTESLTLRAGGNGQMDLGEVLADDITLLAAGNSRLVLGGEVDAARLEVSGSSQVDAAALRAQRVQVQARGASRTTVHAGAHLSGAVSGTAVLSYSGTPDLSVEVTQPAVLESMAGAPGR